MATIPRGLGKAGRSASASVRVLGIDPGLGVTGYAVIEPEGGASGRVRVVEAGIIRGGPTTVPFAERLARIHDGIQEVLESFRPTSVALEQVHSHPNHPRTSILMAHARGVIVLAAAHSKVSVVGYAPSRVKKTLTGSGKASKLQMQHAIQVELQLDRPPEPHDVADACAVALCHFQTERNRRGLGYE